jgi:hypothetical protein
LRLLSEIHRIDLISNILWEINSHRYNKTISECIHYKLHFHQPYFAMS